MLFGLCRNEFSVLVRAVGAVIGLEILELQMRNLVIIPDDCLHAQKFHICVCLASRMKVVLCEIVPCLWPAKNTSRVSSPKLDQIMGTILLGGSSKVFFLFLFLWCSYSAY